MTSNHVINHHFTQALLNLDTIVAPITPPGHGGIAVLRVSGLEAWLTASRVFDRWPREVQSHRAIYGCFCTGDDGLALAFAEGHSFTGEESVEFSIHGSPASVEALVQACLNAGARLAEPGEFTLRAFLSGRLDLTEAEGVRETVEAETEGQLKAANRLRGGSLSHAAGQIRETLVQVLTEIEARVDFSEELGPLDRPDAIHRLEQAAEQIGHLLQSAGTSRILRRGLRVAILGRPNAGKSSLLNALLNAERAIVTPIPGTTRDVIEERIDVRGYPLVLIDTAGIRETLDPIEALGVQRSRLAAADADAVWYLYDSTLGWTPADEKATEGIQTPTLRVATKADLCDLSDPSIISVSSTTRQGLDRLIEWALERFQDAPQTTLINDRHAALLEECDRAIQEATDILRHDRPEDLASVALTEALHSLGKLTGETASPDMIHEIFSRFCLGK